MSEPAPAEIIVDTLAPYLGPHTARTAVRTFAKRALNLTPEALTYSDALKLAEALRLTMGALLGTDKTEEVLRSLKAQLAR